MRTKIKLAKIPVMIWLFTALLVADAHAQTPIQATSQLFTNQFPSGPVTNAVVEGTKNQVPMQPWTIQEIEVVTILRAQRAEMRVTLPAMPLLSLKTNVPAQGIEERKRNAVKYPAPLGPPKPAKRKPSKP